MIDIKIIREKPDLIRQALKNRNDNAPLDEILVLDERYRTSLQQAEALRAKRNEVSKQISKMKDKPSELIAEMRQVGEQIDSLEAATAKMWAELEDYLLRLPNLPNPS